MIQMHKHFFYILLFFACIGTLTIGYLIGGLIH